VRNPAEQTNIGPMTIVAAEQYEPRPLVRDPLAVRLLPAAYRPMAAATRWGPVRRMVARMSEKRIPGLWASMLCRKKFIDDALAADAERGLDAVVVLGAGFDTRAYRLPGLEETRVYEVDLPGTMARKRAAVARVYGRVPAHVTLVPLDFETESLPDALAARGYRPGGRTFFVWEAVTQYLTEDAVRATFGFLAGAAPESRLAFTYVRRDFLDGTEMFGARPAYRDFVEKRPLWRFGLLPDDVPGLLGEYGWRLVDDAGPAELTERYVKPAGRDLPVSEIERSVLAEKV
jgi:methyltransferase (TIGR00027 family)